MKDHNNLESNNDLESNSKNKSLLDSFIPYKMLNLLGKENIKDVRLGDQIEKELTILFADIRGFTKLSEEMTPKENFDFINSYLLKMEKIIVEHNGIIDKFLGDGIMAIFPTSADTALKSACLMLEEIKTFNNSRIANNESPIKAGIGLNTGLCMLGTIGGPSSMECTVISDAVNLASGLEKLTKNYQVNLLIGENTFNNLNEKNKFCIRFIDRVIVKGKSQPQSVYEVFDNDCEESKRLKTETKSIFEEALAHYHYREIEIAKDLLEKCLTINPKDKPVEIYLERCNDYLAKGIDQRVQELIHPVEWDDSFNTGHKEIDSQHFQLFTTSMKLINSVNKNIDKSESIKLLAFLDDYVTHHFRTEEKFLEANNYPFLERQKRQHRNFIKSFETIKMEILNEEKSKIFLMFRIQIFLVDWLVNHTLREDQHFAKYFKSLDGE